MQIDEEELARVLCVAFGDDTEREGMWETWWHHSPYADAARAAIAYIVPKVQEECAKAMEKFELFDDGYFDSTVNVERNKRAAAFLRSLKEQSNG